MDVTKQVVIKKYNPNRFTHVATYTGPISQGRAIDVTNLTTTNTNTSGISHDPINLPNNYTIVWPENLVLEDQTLVTSEGYFYKGTPTYGQYIGRVDLFNWFIEGIENVLDWLIGFITYALKAIIIGWTAILEDVISSILNFGTTPMESTGSTAFNDEIITLNKVSNEMALAYTVNEFDLRGEVTPIAVLANNSNPTVPQAPATAAPESNASNAQTPATPDSNSNASGAQTTVTPTSPLDATETKKKILERCTF